ncbi:HAD-IIB family hydrolase [Arcanobacterium hippocoleae]
MITETTNAALRKLAAAGIPIIIATGRALEWSKYILEDAGVKGWIVASTGSVVWDGVNSRLVDVKLLPEEVSRRAISAARKLNVTFFIETVDEVMVDAHEPFIPHVSQVAIENSNGKRDFRHVKIDEIPWKNLTKITFAAAPNRIAEIEPEIMNYFPSAVRGGPEFLDLTPPNISKLDGITLAQQALGLDSHTGLGAGDSGNDVSWLDTMGISVAAPGATPDLLAKAKYLLPNTENPVADLIHAILAQR